MSNVDKSTNTVWHNAAVTRARRQQQNGHKSTLLWFTGLSGSGKSTLAHSVEEALFNRGCRTFVFDGDNVRHGLCRDLGFSNQDRIENIRRIGEMCNLFLDAGMIALTAFISPFRKDREFVRSLVGENDFIEIYCDCAIEICESRDVKGLYERARKGEIGDFTGISSPYEEPMAPALRLDTGNTPLEECVESVISYLEDKNIFSNV